FLTRFLPGNLASFAAPEPINLRIHLATNHEKKAADIEPYHQHDEGSETSIEFLVVTKMIDVVAETQRPDNAPDGGKDTARRKGPPGKPPSRQGKVDDLYCYVERQKDKSPTESRIGHLNNGACGNETD